jgi:hypothetical protein
MNWFKENTINILDWPIVAPVLNLIENLWNIIDKNSTTIVRSR